MNWGNRLFLSCGLACLLALVTAASNINDGWLVPSGDVIVDHSMLNRETPLACTLTFDDGPDKNAYTLEILRILDEYDIPATFFLIGQNIEAYPEQVRAVRNAGHEIGNHSYSHPHLPTLNRAEQRREIERTNAILAGFGIETRWFRPPYGAHNSTTLSVASQLGVSPINWSVDPRDWAAPGVEVIQQRVAKLTGPGSVILLHSSNAQTVAALPGIIEDLQHRGYQFLSLTQWSQLISGDSRLEELIRAPRELDPQWEQFIKPFRSESVETVVTLPEEEREPVNPLRVFSNFSQRQGIHGTFSAGGLTRFVETATQSSLKRPSQFRQPPPVMQKFIRPVPSEPVSNGIPQVLNTAVVEAAEVPALPQHAAALPESGFALPGLHEIPQLPTPSARTTMQSQVLCDLSAPHAANGLSTASFRLLLLSGQLSAETWAGLNNFATWAQLDGAVLLEGTAPEVFAHSVTSQSRAKLDWGRVVDLTTDDVADVLNVIQHGQAEVLLAVRPLNAYLFAGATEPALLGVKLRDLVLLSWATQELELVDDLPSTADWKLPKGIEVAHFSRGERRVVVIYSQSYRKIEVTLAEAYRDYLIVSLSATGQIVGAPPSQSTVTVDRSPVILLSDPALN